ncbi:hypothetical protein [Nocardia sp. MW-W600-9]
MTSTGGAVPLDPTVLELLRGSSLAPMLDQPVSTVLGSLGLPQLPQLPQFVQLPELPPLPTIDLTALMQPLTELASAFGTGQLGSTSSDGTSTNPADVLSNISSGLQTAMSLGSQALTTVMSLWQSMAATQATEKAAAAQSDGAELAQQSTSEKAVLVNAAGSVALGGAKLSAVMARYSATLALAPLYAATPVGQAALVAATVEAITEGLAITAETKVQLVGHSAEMTQAGQKVDVTNAPTGVNSSSSDTLTQLMSMITPLISTVSTVTESLTSLAAQTSSLSSTNTQTAAPIAGELSTGEDALTAASGGGLAAAGGIGAVAAGLGGGASTSTPLSPWQGRGAVSSAGAVGGAGSAGQSSSESTVATTGSAPGYMPMGAGGAGLARPVDGGGEAVHSNLVTGQHGDEVVGQLEGVSAPVVGAAAQPMAAASEVPPDKELSL